MKHHSATEAMSKPTPITQMIRRIVEDERVRALPDGELVRLFRMDKDQAAFHGLIRRHGGMVLHVCRHVLPNEADAEDAFQATFVSLALKASTIRDSASVGSWLYGVAYRTALKLRAAGKRRNKHELGQAGATNLSSPDDLSWREVQATIYAELNRLSERYRAPLVLCYLEGKTQDQAALTLGISKTSLKKHLESARALLRVRLLRRGIGAGGMLVAGSWPGAQATACLPTALIASTLTSALGAAAKQTAIGLSLIRLSAFSERVVNAMFLTKLRAVTVLVLMLGIVPIGNSVLWSGAQQADGVPPGKTGRLPPQKQDAVTAQGKGADAKQDPLLGEWDGPVRPVPSWFKELADKSGQVSLTAWLKAGKNEEEFKKWDRNDNKAITWDEAIIGSGAGMVRLVFTDMDRKQQPGLKLYRMRWSPPPIDVPGVKIQNRPIIVGPVGGGGGAISVGGAGGAVGGGGIGSPALMATMPHGISGAYSMKDVGGKQTLVLRFAPNARDQDTFDVPFSVKGDTVTLEGGMFEVGARGNNPPLIKTELKGQWHRVDTALEKKLMEAFPGMDVPSFLYKFDLPAPGLLIAAEKMDLPGSKVIQLGGCAIARYAKGSDSHGEVLTAVRSRSASLTFENPVSKLADLSANRVLSIEFADGARVDLKEK